MLLCKCWQGVEVTWNPRFYCYRFDEVHLWSVRGPPLLCAVIRFQRQQKKFGIFSSVEEWFIYPNHFPLIKANMHSNTHNYMRSFCRTCLFCLCANLTGCDVNSRWKCNITNKPHLCVSLGLLSFSPLWDICSLSVDLKPIKKTTNAKKIIIKKKTAWLCVCQYVFALEGSFKDTLSQFETSHKRHQVIAINQLVDIKAGLLSPERMPNPKISNWNQFFGCRWEIYCYYLYIIHLLSACCNDHVCLL